VNEREVVRRLTPIIDLVYRLWAQHTKCLSSTYQRSSSLVLSQGDMESSGGFRSSSLVILSQGDMESSGGFKIDKLNDNNYHTSKQEIELLLAFRDLNEVVFKTPPAGMESNLEVATLFFPKRTPAQKRSLD
jgi:hypothetical protein